MEKKQNDGILNFKKQKNKRFLFRIPKRRRRKRFEIYLHTEWSCIRFCYFDENLSQKQNKHFFSIHEFRFFVDFVVCCFRCKINWWFYFFFINSFVELHHTHTHTNGQKCFTKVKQKLREKNNKQTNEKIHNEETRIFFLSLFYYHFTMVSRIYRRERERESSIHSTYTTK